MLSYEYLDDEGNTQNVSTKDIENDLAAGGYQLAGRSEDGSNIVVEIDGQKYDTNLADFVNAQYGKINAVKPDEGMIDYDGLNLGWRTGIDSLPNDDNYKRSFLEGKLKNVAGVEDPKLVGSGDDWYYFNPQLGKYQALTNKPGLDMSDAFGFLPTAAKALGSGIGMGMGATAGAAAGGIGAVPGGAFGAAAGSQVASAGITGIGALADPEFRDSIKKNFGNEESMANILRQKAVEVPLDAALGGLAQKIPGIKNYLEKGLVSRFGKGVGTGAEIGGSALNKAAKLADNPIGGSIVSGFGPAGQVSAAGVVGELPEMAIKGMTGGGAKLANKVGDYASARAWDLGTQRATKPVAKTWDKIAEGSASVRDFLTGPMRKRQAASPIDTTIENVASKLGGAPAANSAGARDILGNLAEEGMKRARDPLSKVGVNVTERAVKNAARFGEMSGAGVENLAKLGRGLQAPIDAASRGAIKGARGLGAATEAAGTGLRRASTLAGPLEGKFATKYGIEEASGVFPQKIDESTSQLAEWYKSKTRSPSEIYGGRPVSRQTADR